MIDPAVIRASAARGDVLYPYAVYMPLPEATRQPRITVRSLIFHSQAGPRLTSLESLWAYVNRDDIDGEMTFILDLDGRMAQLVPADVRADCHYKANPFAGSVETQDRGSPTLATTPWTVEQVEQLAGLAAWYHLRFGVALEPPARWDATGVGFHSQYPEWSKYVGKTCPGAARIGQMPQILDMARQLAAPPISVPQVPRPPVDPEEDDDMAVKYIRHGRHGAVYGCSGNFKTWIENRAGSDASAVALQRAGVVEPEDVDETTCVSYGPILGPIPAGHDAYGRVVA